MSEEIDARGIYDEALAWVHGLMCTVPSDLLEEATPCPEFTVRALLGHLIGTAERGLATAQGRSTEAIPHVITDVRDALLADRYSTLRRQLRTTWSARSMETVHAPWGITTGLRAVWGFATETLIHGWDLAVATNQPSEAPPDVVQPVLERAHLTLPANQRTKSYGDVITSQSSAGPTERLANWAGHLR